MPTVSCERKCRGDNTTVLGETQGFTVVAVVVVVVVVVSALWRLLMYQHLALGVIQSITMNVLYLYITFGI